MNEWLPEQLKTIKSMCDIAQILINTGNNHFVPTILELMQIEIQQVVEENCIEAPNQITS